MKWLGSERISVFAADAGNRLGEYIKRPVDPVLIMSYEMFVRSFEELEARLKFDLVICDEGHRLKNDKTKASNLISQLATERKIVLTGTPLQNDL
jgi:DNA repair and recombination protein RAD54B